MRPRLVVDFPQRRVEEALVCTHVLVRVDVDAAVHRPVLGLALVHQAIAGLQHLQSFIEAYKGPAEIVWGDRDAIIPRGFGAQNPLDQSDTPEARARNQRTEFMVRERSD